MNGPEELKNRKPVPLIEVHKRTVGPVSGEPS